MFANLTATIDQNQIHENELNEVIYETRKKFQQKTQLQVQRTLFLFSQ